MNIEGGEPLRLVEWGDAPVWSPDGRRIAFSRSGGETGSGVYAMEADGSWPVKLTRDLGGGFRCAWSPDGAWVGFILQDGDIWAAPAAGGEPVNLTGHFQKPICEFCWVPR